ncbi:MAG: CoA activase [bacterium]|nr:CoA activase [bacterium]
MKLQSVRYKCGVDIGSTTAKMVVLDGSGMVPVFSVYRRHDARIQHTLIRICTDLLATLGDVPLTFAITGSAGIGLSERLHIPFVQEVIAAADLVAGIHPDVRSLLDIGGEDSKLVLFDDLGRSDIRMNGSCAGGTGAFIDQMATLLDVPVEEFDALAGQYKTLYPIASRCGVFAKTDVQNLLSRGMARADIAASVLNAVAQQTANTLARGFEAKPRILFSGGPLTFIPLLRRFSCEVLGIDESDVVTVGNPVLLSAQGAALTREAEAYGTTASRLLAMVKGDQPDNVSLQDRDQPLFANPAEQTDWEARRFTPLPGVALEDFTGGDCFLGVDSGSTTTKLVLVDEQGRIVLDHYTFNKGDHLAGMRRGLEWMNSQVEAGDVKINIVGSAVTGYGEDLIRTAFDLDRGIVETLAHFRAASELAPDVSFVLDIGGQDMKALFIEDGGVNSIEINEACSSGCGSFLQSFAEVLDYSVEQFADLAGKGEAPCKLGSRCTVFMNSRVKQFQREGAAVADISAGLAYSVVRNCLTKVLKIRDMDVLGARIIVQGGTFLSPAIQRAFELLTGREVICPDRAGLTGAWGAALYARDFRRDNPNEDTANAIVRHNLATLSTVRETGRKEIHCRGCENICRITRLRFDPDRVFYSGNRCERIFSTSGERSIRGENIAAWKEDLLFNRSTVPAVKPRARIGVPRALNIFENYPFWHKLLTEVGYEVVLSPPSSPELNDKGVGTIMSDSICFPAKLMHGHVLDLIEQGVDRIFYPQVIVEQATEGTLNSFNCPIVSGYPNVIRSAIDPEGKHNVPLDMPVVNLRDPDLLRRTCRRFLKGWGIGRIAADRALRLAIREQIAFTEAQVTKTREVIERARDEGRRVIMMIGRPYHIDRFINQGIPETLANMGMDVVVESGAPDLGADESLQVLTQWGYPNRLYNAARFACEWPHVEVVQVNSFACGPDAMACDELSEILAERGKNLTVLRVDENSSPGSIRLRLRTLVEMLRLKRGGELNPAQPRPTLPTFGEEDRRRTILVPNFTPILAPVIESEFKPLGYDLKVLPPADAGSLEYGLKYVNNEVCYPAILLVGDILRALDSGKYDLSRVAVGFTQTGGQCRASSYLWLLKKGLMAAGYRDIPVIGVALSNVILNEQPGFTYSRKELAKRGLPSIFMADALSMMSHALEVREVNPGTAKAVAERHIHLWLEGDDRGHKRLVRMLEGAVEEMSAIPVHPGEYPRIGVVGEIYVKHDAFSNHNVVQWLTGQGVEVVQPPLTSFFIQAFINIGVNIDAGVARKRLVSYFAPLLERQVTNLTRDLNSVLDGFPFGVRFPDMRRLADRAAEALEPTCQYGESWLLPGEMLEMAAAGIENVLCLQPFGCIANQVIAKGVEKRLREIEPGLKTLYIDLDHNTSEANMFNRIHFMIKNARRSLSAPDPDVVELVNDVDDAAGKPLRMAKGGTR